MSYFIGRKPCNLLEHLPTLSQSILCNYNCCCVHHCRSSATTVDRTDARGRTGQFRPVMKPASWNSRSECDGWPVRKRAHSCISLRRNIIKNKTHNKTSSSYRLSWFFSTIILFFCFLLKQVLGHFKAAQGS